MSGWRNSIAYREPIEDQHQQREYDGVGQVEPDFSEPCKQLDNNHGRCATTPGEIMRPLRDKNIIKGMYALAWTDVIHQIAKIVTVPDESVRKIITHHRQQ